ncbi:hypothetical protein AB1Y20_002608 [Prymnesium parvum]|uniref:Glycosyl transferase family 1 domain-containing protein n=1 Tax=Prymnesium parvum TaxID=97485 RepID=A0AB34JAV9_PRYPA
MAAAVPSGGTVVLSSLTASTGNAVTAQRIAAHLGASTLDLASFPDAAALSRALAARRCALAFGIHAYRAGRLLVGCGVPFVLILGGTDVNEHLSHPAKRAVMAAALAEARAVVAFHPPLRLALEAALPEVGRKVVEIPQAVLAAPPLSRRAELRAALRLEAEEALLLLPAGLRPVKDVLWAAHALEEWHQRDPTVCVRLVGPRLDETYAAAVEDALAAQQRPRAVVYCGPLGQAELHEAMRLARAVLNTSVSEGMCNSILEAFLLETPVVARCNSGNATLINHGVNGFLAGSPEELVELTASLLADGELAARLARSAKEHVDTHHSVAREAEMYAQVAEFALSRPKE